MNLVRIEIGSFGGMRDCALDGIGEGLTVVLGPNEAGKSTYAALVRQVLYGYPDKRSKDYGYVPRDGIRRGRLVFAEGEGAWAIERVDGPKRGPVTVTSLAGPERPHLLEEITGSVSEQTYRMVFGFGLDELREIGASDDDAVVGRLYAGAHGLAVNPMDVKAKIETAAGLLFKPRGKSALNDVRASLKEQQAVVRELEAKARQFAADQQERVRIAERLAPLRARREELERAVRVLERETSQAVKVDEDVRTLATRVEELRAARAQALEARDRVRVNEQLLAVEPEVVTLLAEELAMKQRLSRADSLEARAAQIERSMDALDVPDGVADSVEARAVLDEWREKRAGLQAELEMNRRAAQAARARAGSLAEEEAGRAGSGRNMPALVAGVALVVAGIAAAALGLVTSQLVAVALGAVVALVGVVLAVLGVRRPRHAGELSLDAARLAAEAEANETIATAAATALAEESGAWEAYLTERGLDARGADPAAVVSLLDDARTRRELGEQAKAGRAEAQAERAAVAAWSARLSAVVAGPLGLDPAAAADGFATALRAGDAVRQARDAQAEREESVRTAERLADESAEAERRLKAAREQLTALAAHHGADGDVVASLQAKIEQTETDLELAKQQYEELAREHTRLETILDEQGRDASMVRARQRIEGLRQRASADADRYLVEALALRLLDTARERFERDRQPEVLRTAGRVFSAMTDGRFSSVRAPLSGNSLVAITATGTALSVEQLSRGTAEQLYLALRVGLIESFGEQGPHLPVLMDDIGVNFDDERREAACAAVADLASSRQVVFFTCHESTARTLAGALPGASTLVLDRCTL